ncbi:hypothetical protein OS493_025848 [Desmophyllum pertusum]|uniref:CUB domain-containing protein n=1 Tax=Desmophyllum pertusum TaxID=174260 RepID=A0A9W9YXQ2_9CNID|nr:hypothetical protein OS493_025848 [Desmophyllum pertusum]
MFTPASGIKGLILVASWIVSSGAQSQFSCSSFGQTLKAESSTIKTLTSPNYPSDYKSNTDCSWTIETSQHSGYIVEVTFDDFRLESDHMQSCGNDYLAVYDGSQISQSDIGTFCGFMDTPMKIYSTGRYLSLRFVTDIAANYRGFKLSYFAVPAVSDKKKCFLGNIDNNNLELEGSSGTFESPRYPLKYPKFMSCTWVITVPEGKLVKLSFQKFDVEWSANCDEDYVRVYDGQYSTSTVKKTLCGSYSIPDDIYSTGRYMRIHFSSDMDNYSNYGFKVQFQETNPNVKILGVVIGVAVVFCFIIIVTCIVLRYRRKRTANSQHQASSTSAPTSTSLTPIQHPYPPPPQAAYQPYTYPTPTVDYSMPSAHTYPAQPPPPYPYPAESPPPYPGEERAPQYPPPGSMYPWQQQN